MAFVMDTISWIAVLAGSFFCLTGGLGIVRFPDIFSRLHPAGIIDTLGAGLILLGLIFQAGLTLVTIKLLLIFAFLLFTSPTATHALAKAALHGHVKPLVDKPHA